MTPDWKADAAALPPVRLIGWLDIRSIIGTLLRGVLVGMLLSWPAWLCHLNHLAKKSQYENIPDTTAENDKPETPSGVVKRDERRKLPEGCASCHEQQP